ncbi:Putative disease resistance TIR-NBS-LRR class protein [Prunus dulcis]|uniref:ADP-ribosyl cyclase/cyclic ADP-ribose hydrolase n=1 Tax=Prunus dulcis TaxID=3755 RepID=A0A5H2XMI0_PRUDU|nr:Putative disease resistance TIR-NBS-LRR class protein [Prunus dulcis]
MTRVDDVRFIGIWGMGGIDNVQKGGLISQQREILSRISMKTIDIFDVHEGSTMIRRLLHHKKVLLILDDVTDSDHLDYLAGKQEWFGSGSRVLITTRNEHFCSKRWDVKVNRECLDEPGNRSRLWRHEETKHVLSKNTLLYNLKIIKLSRSLNLVNTPDFRGFPNLEYLILEGCIRLYKVDPSLGMLERITQMKDCKSLVHLPKSVYGLKFVKVLNLSGCSKLNKLPNDLGNAECWRSLIGNQFVSLPNGISLLSRLQFLNLEYCERLQELPEVPQRIVAIVDNCISLERIARGSTGKCELLLRSPYYSRRISICCSWKWNSQWFNHKSAEYIYNEEEWFNPQSVEYPLSVALRPGWFTENWMGFAVCIAFAIHERSPNCDHALKYPSFDYNYTHIITCKVDINGKEVTARGRPFVFLNAELGQALWKGISNQVELPSGTEWWQARVGHGVIVKQCAARLVYEGDLEELDPRFSLRTRSNVSISEMNATTTAMRATTTGTTRVLILPPTASGLTMYFLDTLFRSTEYYRNEKLQ